MRACVRVCVYMYLCMLVLQRPKEVMETLRVVGSDGCKLPDGDARNQTLSPLRE